jgi:hypothetical protein
MNAVVSGIALGTRRLMDPYLGVAAGISLMLVLIVARLERSLLPAGAADRTLVGAAFGIAMPLFAYAVVSRASEGSRWDHALDVVGRHGLDRRLGALGSMVASGATLAFAGLVLGGLTVTVARGFGDPLWARDALSSALVGSLAGAGYAAWFALGSALGRRGGGRFWLLIADWLLGSGTTALALFWPRAHVRNLIGAPPVLDMSQPTAALSIGLLSAVCIVAALWRTPR